MKLSQKQLRKIISEEVGGASRRRRLHELHPGSNAGSYIKQGIQKIWEADNFIQKALAEVESNEEHNLLSQIHATLEKLAYAVHDKAEHIISGGANQKQKPKAPPPSAPGSKKPV